MRRVDIPGNWARQIGFSELGRTPILITSRSTRLRTRLACQREGQREASRAAPPTTVHLPSTMYCRPISSGSASSGVLPRTGARLRTTNEAPTPPRESRRGSTILDQRHAEADATEVLYDVPCVVLCAVLYAVLAVRRCVCCTGTGGRTGTGGFRAGVGARHGHGSRTPRLRRGESGYSGPQRRSGGSERRAAIVGCSGGVEGLREGPQAGTGDAAQSRSRMALGLALGHCCECRRCLYTHTG